MLRMVSTLFAVALLGGTGGALARVDGADAVKGAEAYTRYCATCHGENGAGVGIVRNLEPPPRDFTIGDFKFGGTDQDIFEVISNGAASKGGSPLMGPWGALISTEDRWGLVKHIRSFKK